MFENEVTALLRLGLLRSDAERRAMSVVIALLRNDRRLATVQADTSRCRVCNGASAPGHPLIPALNPHPGHHDWIHLRCHEEHIRTVEARVRLLIRNAGVERGL